MTSVLSAVHNVIPGGKGKLGSQPNSEKEKQQPHYENGGAKLCEVDGVTYYITTDALNQLFSGSQKKDHSWARVTIEKKHKEVLARVHMEHPGKHVKVGLITDVQEKPAVPKEIKIHWADEPGKNPLHGGFATSIVFKPVGNVKFIPHVNLPRPFGGKKAEQKTAEATEGGEPKESKVEKVKGGNVTV